MARRRTDVYEAAQVLGISTDAVRKRARRGTLDSEKDADGHLYIWLDEGAPRPDGGTPNGTPGGSPLSAEHSSSLVEELRDRIRYLEEESRDRIRYLEDESRRKDHLLAAALERIPPALEEPSDAPGSSVRSSPEEGGAQTAPDEDRPSWLRRFFGF
jgi:hypothetical protein